MTNSSVSSRSRKRQRHSMLLFVGAAFTSNSQCLCSSALYIDSSASESILSSSSPSSIANVAGIVPSSIVEHWDEESPQLDNSGPFFWTDRLSDDAKFRVLGRWQQRQRSTALFRTSTQRSATKHQHRPFSLLSWNILSQTLYENSLQSDYSTNKFTWEKRLEWIFDTIFDADADVVCLQEVEKDIFHDLMAGMQHYNYHGVVQGGYGVKDIKRRKGKGDRAHLCATFWKHSRFQPVSVIDSDSKEKGKGFAHMARARTLTCVLQDIGGFSPKGKEKKKENEVDDALSAPTIAVVNCHLEGHPRQYAARIRQLQHAMEDLAKRRTCGPNLNGLAIAGDFNCELQSSACSTYLRVGRVGRKGGLGGVHGTSAFAVPPSILESEEAAEMLHPIIEWGNAIPNEDMENVEPHPFRRNSMLSAYPPTLGQTDPSLHFTYCANPNRPVAGLDQIWYSGFSLTRMALRKMFATQEVRRNILKTGAPTNLFASDHLPIGAVFDWNSCDESAECYLDSRNKCSEAGVRELIVTEDEAPPIPKAKSPIMAYAEMDMLLCTSQFDSEEQRVELESIVEEKPDLPPDNRKPSDEQLQKLRELRDRKKKLMMNASDPARETIQRILKLKKEVSAY